MLRIKVTSVSVRLEKGIHFEGKWERALFGGDDICQRIMDLTIHLICIEGLWKMRFSNLVPDPDDPRPGQPLRLDPEGLRCPRQRRPCHVHGPQVSSPITHFLIPVFMFKVGVSLVGQMGKNSIICLEGKLITLCQKTPFFSISPRNSLVSVLDP